VRIEKIADFFNVSESGFSLILEVLERRPELREVTIAFIERVSWRQAHSLHILNIRSGVSNRKMQKMWTFGKRSLQVQPPQFVGLLKQETQ
jgi:hypothetical protein